MSHGRAMTILMADDDEDDCALTRDALKASRVRNDLRIVSDGEELLDYLLRRGKHASPDASPRPDIILLDLNMPRMDGREALRAIKAEPALRRIPVIVLTTSHDAQDIFASYDTGASSFITKPVTFDSLVEMMKALGTYWFDTVDLPDRDPA